jgi:hypothetical protein
MFFVETEAKETKMKARTKKRISKKGRICATRCGCLWFFGSDTIICSWVSKDLPDPD